MAIAFRWKIHEIFCNTPLYYLFNIHLQVWNCIYTLINVTLLFVEINTSDTKYQIMILFEM